MTQAGNTTSMSSSKPVGTTVPGAQSGGESVLGLVTWSLNERIKELCCLYAVSEICDRAALTLDETIQRVVDVIPPGWQHPDICSARVRLGGREYRSGGFAPSDFVQAQSIMVDGDDAGTLEVFYSEERPQQDEGPFLHEERQLVDDIALRLGKVIESRTTQRGLGETEARRRALLTITRALIVELDSDGVVQDFHVGDWSAAAPILSALHRTSVHAHQGRCVPQRIIEEGMHRVRRVLSTGVPETYEQRVGANGSARDFEVRIAAIGSARALVSISEITERRVNRWEMARIIERAQVELAANVDKCVCQELGGISRLATMLAGELPAVVERANELVERVDGMLAKSQGMVSCLCPTRLETDGLLPALRDLAKHSQARANVDCTVEHTGWLPQDYIVSLQLFRIARETVETMVRHSTPQRIRIGVDSQQGLTTLRIDAEGSRPFQGSPEAAETSRGVLHVRAAAIGATLDLHEEDGLRGVVCRVAAG